MDAIQGDRRSDRRYQITLRLSYQVLRADGSVIRGTGWTRNMSGGGVLCELDAAFLPGQVISLRIEWPRKLQDRFPLELITEGVVVRCDETGTSIRMDQYELRTTGTGAYHTHQEPVRKLVAVG